MSDSGTPLFNPNDNVTGRDGGPYLDEVEARTAEARRAVVEDREPDYDNPPATAGLPLLPAGQMLGIVGVNNLPSQAGRYDLSNSDLIQKRADDEDNPNFTARGEIPSDFTSEAETVEEQQQEEREAAQDSESEDEDYVPAGVNPDVELNSHDPASGEPDLSASDEDETGEAVDAFDLNYDGQYPDQAQDRE